jgi:hypothetical protein
MPNGPIPITQDFLTAVRLGRITGWSDNHQDFGSNSIGTSFVDVWWAGSAEEYLTTAELLDVFSSDTDDDGTVLIIGLDQNDVEITESVVLDGTNVVNTTTAFKFVNYAKMTTATTGSDNNLGNITMRPTTSTTKTKAYIPIGQGHTAKSQYRVPAGKRAIIYDWDAHAGKNDDFVVFMQILDNGAWHTENRLLIYQNTGHEEIHHVLSTGGQVRVTAKSGNASRPIYGHFKYLLGPA